MDGEAVIGMAVVGTAIMVGGADGVDGGVQVSTLARVIMDMGITPTLDTHTMAATDTIIGGTMATGAIIATTIATS
jgi:hypothetical protein